MTDPTSTLTFAPISIRQPIVAAHARGPARLMLNNPSRSAAGSRWRRKGMKALYTLLCQRLGLWREGTLVLPLPNGERGFTANFANTGYIDCVNRAGGYEPEVTALLEVLAGRVATVYDIGANWGFFVATLMANPKFTGHIHTFEISPSTFRDLQRMVKECGFATRVQCHPFGLSDRAGTAYIREGMHSYLTRISDGDGRAVPVARLDDLDLPDPDLIKMDVEGHEAAVLRGAAERLRRARPAIVFESWHNGNDSATMLEPFAILAALGYRFYGLTWAPASSALTLAPLDAEHRAGIASAMNILALHPDGPRLLSV